MSWQSSVNECFLILIEIVDIIFKTAVIYSTEVAIEYHIDEIIDKLADFLRFIREITSNYRRNGHKTNCNNAISILFLLCRLLIFKEESINGGKNENSEKMTSPMCNGSVNEFDISQRIKCISLRDARKMLEDIEQEDDRSIITLGNNTGSQSTLGHFVTARENMDNSMCKKELEKALLDFPLKHFYPQVNELIAYALKVNQTIFFTSYFLFPDKL